MNPCNTVDALFFKCPVNCCYLCIKWERIHTICCSLQVDDNLEPCTVFVGGNVDDIDGGTNDQHQKKSGY